MLLLKTYKFRCKQFHKSEMWGESKNNSDNPTFCKFVDYV